MPASLGLTSPIIWLLFCGLLLTGCMGAVDGPRAGAPDRQKTITVMAASSLTDAFVALANLHEEQHPGTRVVINFSGSQQLAQQLAQGAQADVFASASPDHMQAVVEGGRVDEKTVRVFARNRLVMIVPKGNPADLGIFTDLRRPGLKIVLAAKEVPAGRYTLQTLDTASQSAEAGASFRDDVLANVVSYEDNVRAVLAKVTLGEADAGIVYATDATGPGNSVEQIIIPDAWNITAQYPLAVISDSAHPAEAQAFVDTVLSPAGQKILQGFGFLPAAQ